MVEVFSADVPFKGLRSELDPELLGPGEYNRSQNFRHDTGRPTARNGTALYIAAPESGMTLIDLIPASLNGTHYLLGFFLKSGETRIYASSQGSQWLEITEIGGFSGGTTGNTRFATNTGQFAVSVVKTPQGFLAGSIEPSRDVAVISNGADDVRIWDPGRTASVTLTVSNVTSNSGLIRVTFSGNHSLNTGDTVSITGVVGVPANGSWTVTRISGTVIDLQGSVFSGSYTSGGTALQALRLTVHKKVTVPSDATVFLQKASFHRFWQVMGTTGKTYYSKDTDTPPVNDTSGDDRYDLSNAAAGSSTSAEPLIVWSWGINIGAAEAVATVYFANTPLQLGKGLVIATEDRLATFGADMMFANCKIEVNTENVAYNLIAQPWTTVYDPSSADDRLRRYDASTFVLNPGLSDLPRKLWFFPCDHIQAADKLIYHIRFTRLANAPNPASLAQCVILAICGAGSFPGGFEFTISYEDQPGRSESPKIVASSQTGAALSDIGGPVNVDSTQAVFRIPVSGGCFYDYDLVPRNSDGPSEIEGGLNGEPSRINIYGRAPISTGLEPKALYLYSIPVYAAGAFAAPFVGLGWLKSNSGPAIYHKTSAVTDTYGFDWSARQIDRFAPSNFQICIPPHNASLAKNGRLFVGDVKDPAGQRQRGDGYFSGWGQPFRNQALVESEDSGGRFTADGETIKRFVSSAAGEEGVSHIHVLTDKWVYPLGGSGSAGANPLDATQLGVLMPAVGRGTNAPRSVCEKDGAIFYLDNTGQFIKIAGRVLEISRHQVGDKPDGVPGSRIASVSACVFDSRMYCAYTIPAGTTNTRILGWNDLFGAWEFDDQPPVDAERICVLYDPTASGSGLRLLIGTQAGAVYQYESGGFDLSTNPIAVRLTTGDFSGRGEDHPIQIESVDIDADPQSNTLTIDRILNSPAGVYRTTVSLAGGHVTDSDKEHAAATPVPDNEDEWSRTARLDIYGNMTAGTKVRKIAANVIQSSSRYAKATA